MDLDVSPWLSHPLADCCHQCAKLGCVGQAGCAIGIPKGTQFLLSTQGLLYLLVFCLLRKTSPPLLWKLHPSPNHGDIVDPVLADCSVSPSLVIPCYWISPVTCCCSGSGSRNLHSPDPLYPCACQSRAPLGLGAFLKHPF